jgi:ornithine--oxo-acid transaminase
MLRATTVRAGRKVAGEQSKAVIATEAKYSAANYAPLPVVFKTASKSTVVSPEGDKYLDFLSGYGAVSQGHCHPRLIGAVKKQLNKVTLASRAFYSDQFGEYASYITKLLGYDKVLPMNTGAEGVETALKLARRWGYTKKHIPVNKAKIVCCSGNFHGRTFGAITMSNDPSAWQYYGPHLPGFIRIEYGNIEALEKTFKKDHKTICAFICEPIQGEAGVIIPPPGYLQAVRKLCTKYNILYIDDEVQAGLGRTGKMLAVEHENVRPDVVILAKALGGGVMPVAAVLADNKHMVFEPGTHGSTFGGSPLSSALATEALKVLVEERMCQRAALRGLQLEAGLKQLKSDFPFIKNVRCRGLFSAIEMRGAFFKGKSAYRLMNLAKENGVLTKVTHGTTLRITPPLVVTEKEMIRGLQGIRKGLETMAAEEFTAVAAHKAAVLAKRSANAATKKATVKKAVKAVAKKAKKAAKKVAKKVSSKKVSKK